MDALAQLALMTKAKLVFETDNTYLSFPALMPLSYPPDKLKFGASLPDYNTWNEFCRLTNVIPGGTLYQPEQDVYLWDLYESLFAGKAQLANSTLTPQEAQDYAAVTALLYTIKNGMPVDTPTMTAYKKYRDLHIIATEKYKEAELTALTSTDAEVKHQWETVKKAVLRQEVDQAMSDWVSKGSKLQIEQAMQKQSAYAAKASVSMWTEWSHAFNRDTDMIQGTAAMTGFSPFDVFDRTDWPTFKLTSAEINQLISQAPGELRNVLGGSGASNIESISFEFRSVSLSRAWFRPSVFEARFWRMAASEPPISDGGTPATGQCPAYITALVFARNIVVSTKKESGGVDRVPLDRLPVLTLQNAAIQGKLVGDMSHKLMVVRPQVAAAAAGATVSQAGVNRLAMMSFSAAPVAEATSFGAATSAVGMTQAANISATGVIRPDVIHPRVPPVKLPPQPEPTPQPPAPAPDGSISILAFICKRVKKCPDPDPSLTW